MPDMEIKLGLSNGISVGDGIIGGGGDPIGDALRADAVAYWKMDEASGNRTDSTGNAHTLVAVGTVTGVGGKVGNAVHITEAAANALRIINSSVYDSKDRAITFSFWINLDTFSDAEDHTIIWRMSNSNKVDYYSAFNNASGGLWLDVYEGSALNNEVAFIQSAIMPSVQTWYFVVVELDRINEIVKIRVNNTQDQDVFFDTGVAPTGNASSFAVGCEINPSTPDLPQFAFDGKVDEVGFWHRLLTTAEKDYLYNAGAGRTLYP